MGIATIAAKLKSVFGFLATDSTGSIKANVVHRTGTLASLQQLISPVGEIAVATDADAAVIVTATGGKAIFSGARAASLANKIVGHFYASEEYSYPVAGNANYVDLQSLFDFLASCTYSNSATVTVTLDDASYGAIFPISGADFSRVKFVASTLPDYTVDSVVSVTGAANNWDVVMACTPGTIAPRVGHMIGIDWQGTGGDSGKLCGGYVVTAVNAGWPATPQITIKSYGTAAPVALTTYFGIVLATTIDTLNGSNVKCPQFENIGFNNFSLNQSSFAKIDTNTVFAGSVGKLTLQGGSEIVCSRNIYGKLLLGSSSVTFSSIYASATTSNAIGMESSSLIGLGAYSLIGCGNGAVGFPLFFVRSSSEIRVGYIEADYATTGIKVSQTSQIRSGSTTIGAGVTNGIVNSANLALAKNTLSADMSYVAG